jgi:uncharacterized membrane protein YqjE
MSTPETPPPAPGAPKPPPPGQDQSVGELVVDVSERVSTLVREEIELAKTEIREKVTKLIQGGVVGIAAAIFVVMGLAMVMHSIAWVLNDYFFSDHVWIGFLIEGVFWFIIAGIAGLVAKRAMEAGSPPTPDLAIEEAKRTKETLEAGSR